MTFDQAFAREKRFAAEVADRHAAAVATQLRQDAYVERFALSFPVLANEVDDALSALVAEHVAKIPAWDLASLARIERAKRNAFNATMLGAKARYEAARRGPGNRAQRRATRANVAN